ncbi:hypothetical protein N658DRAFT_31448 [Parathielavia hyrcaniae]|uniref:Uncharacterized protein n=1 Tax=Parathielavia hyrcaniae TaxID=113614 RepID=A0AAN6QAV9_9PEZI|nr:hypothetical protein N658DRAFT_31448 [Parathielavia hyrcaniae]
MPGSFPPNPAPTSQALSQPAICRELADTSERARGQTGLPTPLPTPPQAPAGESEGSNGNQDSQQSTNYGDNDEDMGNGPNSESLERSEWDSDDEESGEDDDDGEQEDDGDDQGSEQAWDSSSEFDYDSGDDMDYSAEEEEDEPNNNYYHHQHPDPYPENETYRLAQQQQQARLLQAMLMEDVMREEAAAAAAINLNPNLNRTIPADPLANMHFQNPHPNIHPSVQRLVALQNELVDHGGNAYALVGYELSVRREAVLLPRILTAEEWHALTVQTIGYCPGCRWCRQWAGWNRLWWPRGPE